MFPFFLCEYYVYDLMKISSFMLYNLMYLTFIKLKIKKKINFDVATVLFLCVSFCW